MIGIIMFFTALFMLLIGFPVAFTFGAVSVLFGLIAGIVEIYTYADASMGITAIISEGLTEGMYMFDFMPHRIWSIMNNTILMAVPIVYFYGNCSSKNRTCRKTFRIYGIFIWRN